ATFLTPEVHAALGERAAPWFDASALREGDHKLGLGSSAAILVASLAALELADEPALNDEALCERVYERAFVAHRAAQGGGSGVDVAASAYGGLLAARRTASGSLQLSRLELPSALRFEVWSCSVAASTSAFLATIAEFAARDAALHARCINDQAEAAERALDAAKRQHAADFVAAIARQVTTLSALGAAAGVNIVTTELAELARLAVALGAAFLPAGAGGGDVAYWVGTQAPPPAFAERARELGLSRVELALGARGVHALSALG